MSEEKRPLILIADRQLATLLSLDALLSLEGYRVTTCASSFAVLKAVAREKLDLVIAGRVGQLVPGSVSSSSSAGASVSTPEHRPST